MADEEEEDTFEFQKKLEKARTFSFSDSPSIERSETVAWIEPSEDADRFDIESVTGTVRVRGFELDEPAPPEPDAVKKALKRSDPTADYRRNRKDYGVICPVCFGSGKCVECGGRGRRKLIFKCKMCGGTGKCPDHEKDVSVRCPQCDEPVSKFSDTCSRCGKRFECPECGANLPAMATICPICRTSFNCGNCGKPYPRQYSRRCPHCHRWNG